MATSPIHKLSEPHQKKNRTVQFHSNRDTTLHTEGDSTQHTHLEALLPLRKAAFATCHVRKKLRYSLIKIYLPD